ncbi:MAG: 4-hydroxy-tetrahydrodipicolinate reductase [Verrucomicrobiota bacterium]|nr:4-hydroxy-tetrahydrodipicolinate reductase [Verrucomicrobiota bacterium]
MKKLRAALIGASGRMGRAIISAATNESAVEIAAAVNRGDDASAAIAECDLVIDFSHADATGAVCAACVAQRKPAVIGTTGHSPEQLAAIDEAAAAIPIVFAANFSVGVNALFWLTRHAATLLGDGFDIEIIETHHRLKKDAPSGTAKQLARLLCEARALDSEAEVTHGRHGMVGERPAKQIGMHAIRAGDVVGEHTVLFAGAGERLELTHKASSRDTFAIGALRAAAWVVDQPPRLYRMEDVLGL